MCILAQKNANKHLLKLFMASLESHKSPQPNVFKFDGSPTKTKIFGGGRPGGCKQT